MDFVEQVWGDGGEFGEVLMMNSFGVQLNGTNDCGSCCVGRRGTMEPLARRNNVRPVVQSGPRQTPSSAFGSMLVAVLCLWESETLLSSC